jgi:hypothetical protein
VVAIELEADTLKKSATIEVRIKFLCGFIRMFSFCLFCTTLKIGAQTATPIHAEPAEHHMLTGVFRDLI